jgi:hypothetical protein
MDTGLFIEILIGTLCALTFITAFSRSGYRAEIEELKTTIKIQKALISEQKNYIAFLKQHGSDLQNEHSANPKAKNDKVITFEESLY